MPGLYPFRGMHYNPAVVSIEAAVCPPPRSLTLQQAEDYCLRHPRNAAHLLGPESRETGETLEHWRREGAVLRDQDPAFYVLSQAFRNALGTMAQRMGLVALLRLEEFSAGVVVPHQRTLPVFLEDAVRRQQRLGAHLLPVCLLTEDADLRIERLLSDATTSPPVFDGIIDGVVTRLWKAAAPELHPPLRSAAGAGPLLLASGHHLYEAALTCRDMMRLRTRSAPTPSDFVPVLVTGMREATVQFRPVIRMVRPGRMPDFETFLERLGRWFELTPAGSLVELAELPGGADHHEVGIISPDRLLRAVLRSTAPLDEITDPAAPAYVRGLTLSLLHYSILGQCLEMDDILQQRLEHVSYTADLREAAGAVQRGEASMAFVTPAFGLDHLRRLMRSGGVLPPVATLLAPGVPAGLIMHRLDEVGG
jgi:uncharacterized protein (DUF1015 family)